MVRTKRLAVTMGIIVLAVAAAVVLGLLVGGMVPRSPAYAGVSDWTITVTDTHNGTTNPIGVSNGDNYILSLPTHDGYYISSITLDGQEIVEDVYNETPYVDSVMFDGVNSTYTFQNVSCSHSVVVGYSARQYLITYNTNGGNSAGYTDWGKTGSAISTADPIRTGYDFMFWSEDGTNEFDMVMPAREIVLKAIWTPSTSTAYTIRFYKQTLDLSEYEEDTECYVLHGTTGETASYTPDLYKYDRFDYNPTLSNTSVVIAPDGSSEIGIYYSRGEVVIYFDSMGGTPVESVAAMPGASINAPSTVPTKAGYVFSAWYQVSRTSAYRFNTMPGQDLYLEAHWKALDGIGYVVKFYKQISSELGYAEVEEDRITNLTGTSGELVSYDASSTKYEDYSFQRGKSTTSAVLEGDGSTVLKLYYEKAKYTITLNPGKGELDDSIRTARFGDKVEYPTPEREGYSFAGWYYGSDLVVDGSYPYHKSVTMEARWTAIEYTVTFNTNGGSDEPSLVVVYGGSITKPENDPTKANSTFEGWYLDEGCTEEVDFSSENVTSDMTIYAKWSVNYTNLLIAFAVMFVLLSLGAVIVVSILRRH